MGRIFGTDGVRGIANGDLSIELAMNLGRAAGMVVEEAIERRPVFLVGMDTRISGDMLQSAMAAGLCSAGADVVMLGVVPTPAVAYLVVKYGADAGIMLSASHNPFEYNGIKIFSSEGYKLLDAQEEEIEEIVLDDLKPYVHKTADRLGRISHAKNAAADYISHLCETVPDGLSGMRLAVDCANGSASVTAKLLFERLGAQVDIFHADPDGCNINAACGSTHLEQLAEIVQKGGYDAGIAFDGDADRCLAVDETGALVDGDRLMAIFAYHMKKQGRLEKNTLVATVMSNLGLFRFAEREEICTESTKVGDRYVLETMREQGYCLGGEQSGHVIFLEYMTTGDGQLSAIQLLRCLRESGQKLSEAASVMQVFPQTLLNIHATPEMKQALSDSPAVAETTKRLSDQLGNNGRILVRPSGTEPLIRIMVEGQSLPEIQGIAAELAQVIQSGQ